MRRSFLASWRRSSRTRPRRPIAIAARPIGAAAQGRRSPVREHAGQLVPRGDAELGEHLVEVVLDGAGADEQPRADLGVGEALAGEPGDLRLLRGELVPGLDAAPAGPLAGGAQLAGGTLRERLEPHRREHLVRRAELLARVLPALPAANPLAVEQVAASELDAHHRATEVRDRLAVER